MNTMVVASFPPITSFNGLERLALSDLPFSDGSAPIDSKPIDWDRVNASVQKVLALLADRVCLNQPEIRSQAGRASARYFSLYTYRVFDLGKDVEIDPVIVGLNFEPVPDTNRVRIYGDIGGEGTGRIDFEIEPVEVPSEETTILATAHHQATILAQQADIVKAAVLARIARQVIDLPRFSDHRLREGRNATRSEKTVRL